MCFFCFDLAGEGGGEKVVEIAYGYSRVGWSCPGFVDTLLCPWFRGGGCLDSHATVGVFSNAIGVSMPSALCRRWRLWKTSR
jgi:hypothetical protein